MTDKKATLEQVIENTRKSLESLRTGLTSKINTYVLPPRIIVDELPMRMGDEEVETETLYWAQPKNPAIDIFDIYLKRTSKGIGDVYDWCVKTYGPPGDRWYVYYGKYMFKNEQDRTMFVLKWS